MSLSIHLVTWNGAKYLPYFFASLKRQTYQDWELSILDNGSTDETRSILEKISSMFSQPVHVSYNSVNAGFARGYNQLLQSSSNDLQLIANQDVIFGADCVEAMVRFITWHEEAAAVAPLLLRWALEAEDDASESKKRIIDAVGIRIFRSQRAVEWLNGEELSDRILEMLIKKSSYPRAIEVFGVSGTLALFRRAALQNASYSDGTIFDESYGSYKEDVDLAYRLRSAGYKTFIAYDAMAHHVRSCRPAVKLSDLAAVKNKRSQSLALRQASYINHLVTLYKNEYWQNFLLDFPWIFWYELKKLAYFLLFDRAVLGGLRDAWLNRELFHKRRKDITEKRKVSWKQMRRL